LFQGSDTTDKAGTVVGAVERGTVWQGDDMYLALTYSVTDDFVERRGEFREEHLALARAAHERGELALAGAFTDPADAALLVWSTDDRSVVEGFVEQDPYVRNGLVTAWNVREWNVVIGSRKES
jgi:uncharacterized protein YciI